MYETALQPGEIITSVSFPVPKRAAYTKFKNPASRYAIVGVFVSRDGQRRARRGDRRGQLACSAFPTWRKRSAAKFSPDAVAGIKVAADGLNSDMHASAEYRAHLVTVMAKRAVGAGDRRANSTSEAVRSRPAAGRAAREVAPSHRQCHAETLLPH